MICAWTCAAATVCAVHLLMCLSDGKRKRFMHAVEEAVDTAVDTISATAETLAADIFGK